jgi:hypothetical protein
MAFLAALLLGLAIYAAYIPTMVAENRSTKVKSRVVPNTALEPTTTIAR